MSSAEEAQMNTGIASEEEEVMEPRKCAKRWPGCHHPWKKWAKRHPHPFGMMGMFPPPFMSDEDSEEEECTKEMCRKMKQEKKQEKEGDNEEKVKCTCSCDECKAVREFLKHKMMRKCGPPHMFGPHPPHMWGPPPPHMFGPPHPHMFGPPPPHMFGPHPPHMWGPHPPHMWGPHPPHMWGPPPPPHMFGPPPHMWGPHHRRHRHMGPFPW